MPATQHMHCPAPVRTSHQLGPIRRAARQTARLRRLARRDPQQPLLVDQTAPPRRRSQALSFATTLGRTGQQLQVGLT